MQSSRYKATEFREPGETLWVERTTTFKWFSVDAAGNLEPTRTQSVDIGEGGTVGGTVPPTLSLTLGAPASFGAFTPGVARDYSASTTATVTSSAGNAALIVQDPSAFYTNHLVNGSVALARPLQAKIHDGSFGTLPAGIRFWGGPTASEAVPVEFRQSIGASEPLRTGSYSKTLTFTLSTTSP